MGSCWSGALTKTRASRVKIKDVAAVSLLGAVVIFYTRTPPA